jgi:protein-L-isoaspartate(D-aspartate) O-methyltransferase
MSLIDDLIRDGWLKTPNIIKAFREIKRADFMPASLIGGEDEAEKLAEINSALSIGYGQTISQPLVVAFMIEQLQPQKGDKILDVGSGSGWTTSLLSYIVGVEGKVLAIERIPELKEFGEENAEKYKFVSKGIAEFICGDGSKGYPNFAWRPEFAEGFDSILASASARSLPKSWREQLKIGGRIVAPIDNSIWVFIKNPPVGGEDKFEEIEHPGFVFVPLIGG